MGGLPSKMLIQDSHIEEFFVAQHVAELRQCILQDEIQTLGKKLTEFSAIGDRFIRSVLSFVHEDGNISQTLLMTAIREKNMQAFDLLIDHPVECVD